MKQKFLIGLAFLAASGTVWANPVTPQDAQKAALHFMQMKTGNARISLKAFDFSQKDNESQKALYVFTAEQQPGFVIIAGDDAVRPVLGYSTENDFAGEYPVSPEVTYWLNWYAKQIHAVQLNGVKATEKIEGEWNDLMQKPDLTNGNGGAVAQKTTDVTPMLETTWGQLPYYNDLCPSIPYVAQNPTYHAPAGCVATAMAQIMKYWETPTTNGSGSHSYSTSSLGGSLSADFGNTVYDWNNMPNTLTATSSSAEKIAIATLMFHCGVSVDMDYDTTFSGALVINSGNNSLACSENAMSAYFGYSTSIKGYQRSQFADSNWIKMLKFELDNGRPVLYTGFGNAGGHAFDFDGYNSNDYFHINWGWRGLSNGYFVVDNLNPSALGQGGGGGNFNYGQQALIMIEPVGSTLPPNPYQPDSNQQASLNLIYDQTPSSPYDTIHVGDPYSFSATVKNDGASVFQTPDVLFLVAVNIANNQQQELINYVTPTIPVNGTYTYNFDTQDFTQLDPGSYYMLMAYQDASQHTNVIVDATGNPIYIPLTVLAKDNGTGILDTKNSVFELYPNPAKEVIHVNLKDGHDKLEGIQLMDATGRVVYENKTPTSSNVTIPVASLASGMYYLRLKTTKGSQVEKVSVQH